MAENYAIEGFKEIGRSVGQFCANNKAHICTGISVTGTIATGVLAARSGSRAARKIDRREKELGRRLSRGEKIKLCGGDFIAPAISGILSIGGAVGSDVINTNTIARANIALIASEEAYQKLRSKTREVLGEKKEKQIRDEIAKDKVEQAQQMGYLTTDMFQNAPRSGTGVQYPYADDYCMLPFWSTPDYIALHVKSMTEMMRELKARGDEFDYYDKKIGIAVSEWLKGLNFDPNVYKAKAYSENGWNRGFCEDGSDDDPIEYVTTPIEWSPGFAVTMISWEKDPVNLSLGRLLKSNGM